MLYCCLRRKSQIVKFKIAYKVLFRGHDPKLSVNRGILLEKREYKLNLKHENHSKWRSTYIGNVNLYIRQAEFDTQTPEFDT